MAQVKKFQNSGVIDQPKKIKVNLDGQTVELTEDELDQIYANAFKSIQSTGSVGYGDEANWAKRYSTFKDLAKTGTYSFDTTPDQTLNVQYTGTQPEEDLGLKKGKTRRVTAFGKQFGGVDEGSRQMSEINYYMGSSMRDFLAQKNQAQKKAEEDALSKSKVDAASWAEKFNSNFGLGRSAFGSEYNLQDAITLLKPYWDMQDDESRIAWLQPKVFETLRPIFELDPEKDALKIEALKAKNIDVDVLKSKFQNYYDQTTNTQKLGQLKDLWQYANAQDSTKEDVYFWDKQSYDKANIGKDDASTLEWLQGKYGSEVTLPGQSTPDSQPPETSPVTPESSTEQTIGINNPYGINLPEDIYKLRAIGFNVNNQPVNFPTYKKYALTLPETDPRKKQMLNFINQFERQYQNGYAYHTQTGWYSNNINYSGIPDNAPIRQLFPTQQTNRGKIYFLGEVDNIVVFQTPGNTVYDIDGLGLPHVQAYDRESGQALQLSPDDVMWDNESQQYVVRIGDRYIYLKSLERRDSRYINDLLIKLNRMPKQQKGTVLQLKNEAQLNELITDVAKMQNLSVEEAKNKVQGWYNAGTISIPSEQGTTTQEQPLIEYNFTETKEVMPKSQEKLDRWESQRISQQFSWESLSDADKQDITSIIGDLVSFSGGVTGVVGGVGSAVQSTYANIVRDGFDWSDLGWGTLDQGLAALSAIPVVGGLAKIPRLAKKVKLARKALIALQTGLVGVGAMNQARAVKKIISGEVDELNVQDVRDIVSGFQAIRQGRKIATNVKGLDSKKVSPGEQVITAKFNGKNGEFDHKVKLTKQEVDLIKASENPELATKELLRSRVKVDAELQSRLNKTDVNLDEIELPMTSKFSYMKPWKNRGSIGIKDQVKFEKRFAAVRNIPDQRTSFLGRFNNFIYGDPVKGQVRVSNDPNARSVVLPIDESSLRPRVKLVDSKFVDDVKYEQVLQKSRPELKAKLASNKKGIAILKQYNKVESIDKDLTKTLSESGPDKLKRQTKLLDELRAIDRNMGKAETIAKDITMKSDVATARASVQEIINKHHALLKGQLVDKFKIKPQTTKLLNSAPMRSLPESMSANRRTHRLRTRVNKRESGGILLPMYQNDGIFAKRKELWPAGQLRLQIPSERLQRTLGLASDYKFLPNLNNESRVRFEPRKFNPIADLSIEHRELSLPASYAGDRTFGAKVNLGRKSVTPEVQTTQRSTGTSTGTPTSTDAGAQSGLTRPLPQFKLNEAWQLQAAATLNQIRSLNAQDTRYTPTLNAPKAMPISTTSGSQLIEDQYRKQAVKAEQQLRNPQTSDAQLTAQAGLATQQNLRDFLAEGDLKAQQMRDQLKREQTAQTAANIAQENQAAQSNSAELAKMKNQMRTNENYLIRNKAELESGLMRDYASDLFREQDRVKQLQQNLELNNINKYFDDMFSKEHDQLRNLDSKRYTQGLNETEQAEYDRLTQLFNKIRSTATAASYQYQLTGNPLDLASKYPRTYFEQ